MSTRKFLLPLAGLLAIGLAIAGWTSRPAQATPVGAIQVSQINATTYTVVATYNDDTPAGSGSAVLAATTSTAGIFFGSPTIAPLNGEVITGINSAALTITEDTDAAAVLKTVTATFTCTSTVQTAFTLTHGGSSITSQFICAGGAPGATLQVSPPSQQINLSATVSGICSPGLALTASPGNIGVFQTATGATVTNLTTVSCGTFGSQITATFFCTASGNVTFTLGTQTGTLACGSTATPGIIATPPAVAVNQTATISGNCVGSQQITSSPGGQFQSVITGASYSSPNAITCAGGAFSATFLCGPGPATITFTSGLQTGSLGCGVAAAGGLTLNPPGSGATTVVSGQCSVPGQQLTVTGPGSFSGAQINGVQIPNVAGSTVVTCSQVGGFTAGFNCTTIGTANFNLAGLIGTFSCTTGTGGTCPGGGIFNPATGGCAAASGGVPSTVSISANPSSLQCTGSSSVAFMSVSVKDAQGQNVQDGTSVTITADSGTFAPSQATTLGGNTQFIYSPASTSSGTVNIRANAGSAQGTTTVNVTCSGSSSPPPSSAPVTSPPPPPSGVVTIAPPNTGDAGLTSSTDSNWQLYAATTILVAAAAGAVALVRTKA